MRILLISSSYNGLCQRAHVELEALGHDISITLAINPDDVRKGVTFFPARFDYLSVFKRKNTRRCLEQAPVFHYSSGH